jgi:hypothetical protein
MTEDEKKKKLLSLLKSSNSLVEVIRALYAEDTYFIGKYGSFRTLAEKYNSLVIELQKLGADVSLLSLFKTENMKSSGDTVWPIQKEIIDNVFTNTMLMISVIENDLDIKANEIENIKDFLKSNIRKGVYETPENEKQVQNAIESLLIGKGLSKGLDYDRETGRVKVSSKEVIPDFIMLKLDLAIEVKIIKDKNRIGPVIDEINADITAYAERYSKILFIVYDLGFIRDEVEFVTGFNRKDGVNCIIIKN